MRQSSLTQQRAHVAHDGLSGMVPTQVLRTALTGLEDHLTDRVLAHVVLLVAECVLEVQRCVVPLVDELQSRIMICGVEHYECFGAIETVRDVPAPRTEPVVTTDVLYVRWSVCGPITTISHPVLPPLF